MPTYYRISSQELRKLIVAKIQMDGLKEWDMINSSSYYGAIEHFWNLVYKYEDELMEMLGCEDEEDLFNSVEFEDIADIILDKEYEPIT